VVEWFVLGITAENSVIKCIFSREVTFILSVPEGVLPGREIQMRLFANGEQWSISLKTYNAP